MVDGYLLFKDNYNLNIVCLDNVRDVTPMTFDANSNWLRYLRHEPRSYAFEGNESFNPVPFQQITRDTGYANAYTEIHTAYNAMHDEIAQLEKYRQYLKSDIKQLNQEYNQGIKDLKEYIKWYEAVTEFDKKSYDVWCQMQHDLACSYVGVNDD